MHRPLRTSRRAPQRLHLLDERTEEGLRRALVGVRIANLRWVRPRAERESYDHVADPRARRAQCSSAHRDPDHERARARPRTQRVAAHAAVGRIAVIAR